MEEYLIAVVLIAVGAYFVFFRGGNEVPQPIVPKDKKEEVKEEEVPTPNKEEKKKEETEEVKEIDVDPSLWPKLKPTQITFYFGSQTGTAEKFSKILQQECHKYLGIQGNVIDMEDFDKDEFKESDLNIMWIATHGEGEPTDNALRVHSWIKKTLKSEEKEIFKGVDIAVFGLGDTEYENFCAMGKFFDEKLQELGANKVYDLGFSDASNDAEGDFARWKEKLWPALIERYRAEEGDSTKPEKERKQPSEHQRSKQPLAIRQYVKGQDVRIHSMRELRQTQKYGSCLEIIFDLEGTDLEYKTAANLAVFATNRNQDVDAILGDDEGDVQLIDPAFPLPWTVREALTKYIDLTGSLDRGLLKNLSAHAEDETEKQELLRLSTPEGKDDLDALKRELTTVLELLVKYKSIKLTAEQKLNLLPKMVPRYYTIASSAAVSPTKVRIAISLTEFDSPSGKKFRGLASQFFDRIFKESFSSAVPHEVKARIFFKDSLFKLPESTETPIIMVGPGTGVVPFIAFSEEREYLKLHNSDSKFGAAHLYFGCKTRIDDYIFKEELAYFKQSYDGVIITDLYEAFSREQDKKVYVQDMIRNQTRDQIKDLILKQNAHFYMWGAMDMGKQVEALLEEILEDPEGKYLAKMKEEGRFMKELWSS